MLLGPFGLSTLTSPVAVAQAHMQQSARRSPPAGKRGLPRAGHAPKSKMRSVGGIRGEMGAGPIPGPRSWGTVVWGTHGPCPGEGSCPGPWRSSPATQLPLASSCWPLFQGCEQKGEKKNPYVKRMHHIKAKITPGQRDGDTNPLTSPLSSDSPNHSLRYVTRYYTAWPKNFSRTFLRLPLQQ